MTTRSLSHNRKMLEVAFVQSMAKVNNEQVHVTVLTESLFVGLKDGDFKLWQTHYARHSADLLEQWVRENLRNHPKLKIKGVMVCRVN